MKLSIAGSVVALIVSVSAQNASVPLGSHPASVATPAPSDAASAPASAPPNVVSSCSVKTTFDLCLQNEDNYIKLCPENDYACLCRWHREKLSCWNNCPKDEGLAQQEGVVSSYCSMPGANVSITPWTSTAPATSVPIMPTSSIVGTASSIAATPTNSKSSASTLAIGQGTLAIVGAVFFCILS
ncbi:hypothetical protein K501DRAFT_265821 [Backusella circina FSU 941]|nr:hypothetical protein K501DRAFT_265821 [Backusella circina FSU 941]